MSYSPNKIFLKLLNAREIHVLGFGVEGKSTISFLRKFVPCSKIVILDRRSIESLTTDERILLGHPQVSFFGGENYLSKIKNAEIIVKSAGIKWDILELNNAIFRGAFITTQTQIFLDLCRGKIIGITGSKGKSTTASLFYYILSSISPFAGHVHLLGNIGKPMLSYFLEHDGLGWGETFVLELSSYQLQRVQASPHISIWLNIFSDHLSFHNGMDNYKQAKSNITRYQTPEDICIYHPPLEKDIKASGTSAHLVQFDTTKGVHYDKQYIYDKKEKIIKRNELPLAGSHNASNICAAITAAKELGIHNDEISRVLKEFQILPHRMEPLAFRDKIFVNDSVATTIESTLATLQTFAGEIDCLIIGGEADSGADMLPLAEAILDQKIPHLILVPNTGEKIKKSLEKLFKEIEKPLPTIHLLPNTWTKADMKDVVELGDEYTRSGKYCLFSPAAPSRNHFSSFEERGNLFKENVILLAYSAEI